MKVDIIEAQKYEKTCVEIHCKKTTNEIESLKNYITRFESFITATDEDTLYKIPINSILYIESVDKKTFLYTNNRVLRTPLKLYEIEEQLNTKQFFRCSKSMIINLTKVEKLKPEITRNVIATLSNNEKVIISRRYVSELKKLLEI